MSFRVKTAMLVVVTTMVTMGVAFAAVWYSFVASQRSQLDSALLAVAHREAAEAANGQLSFTDAPGPSANAVGPLPKYGVIYALNGGVVSSTENFRSLPLMPTLARFDRCFDFDHDGTPMRAVVVEVPNSGMRVLLASPREDLEDDARILGSAMAVTFAVGCLWAGLVSVVVATRLTRNYRAIESVARRVAAGDATARVAFASSDTDLEQLASDLNTMIDQLVGLAAAQDRFVAHAAHELRTPLTALRIELEHALKTARDPDEFQNAMRGALDSGRRLSTLADELLVVARARASKRSQTAVVGVRECIDHAIVDVRPLADSREIRIEVEPLGTVLALGERNGVARILRNLLENAVRYTPRGSTVRVSTIVEPARVRVCVRDQGAGIDPAECERAFEPFERLERDDEHQGAGLGLSIARSLARAFGGDVVIDTSYVGGASVEMVLPLREAAAAEPARTGAAVAEAQASG